MQQATASTPPPNSPASSELSSFAGLLAALAAPEQNPGAPVDRSSSTGWNSGAPVDGSSSTEWNPEASGEKPVPARRKAAPAWNDDDLADDVATLSYERALRTHARYHASSAPTEQLPAGQPLTDQLLTGQSRTQTADPEPIGLEKPFSLEEFLSEAGMAAPQAELRPAVKLKSGKNQDLAAKSSPASDRPQTTDCERNLKEASVTIRMSKAECAQLRQRAAEAGLTVSA